MTLHKQHLGYLKEHDSKIYEFLEEEKERQMNGVELIASENVVSQGVLEAMGSVATNKYSEGYSHKRYYGGNDVIDKIEDLAIERAKKLFSAEHVNVQPLSGSPANMAVYFAVMEIGDTAMGMKLTEGGHLTHGHKVNFSGKLYNFEQYGVDKETEMIDYDAVAEQAASIKPKLILSGYTAYSREIDFKRFRKICDEVGAFCMADIAHIAGLCAGGAHENPVPYFDAVTTTTHKTLRGPRGAIIMCKEEFAEKIDKAVFPGLQGGPHDHITAAKAVAFGEALQPDFKEYAQQIVKNAKTLAKVLGDNGLRIISGGTDNHLMLVDVTSVGLSGKEAETTLDKVLIYSNKNSIPFDTRSPWDPSGIRLGATVMTSRGMKEKETEKIGAIISDALKHSKDDTKLNELKKQTLTLCKQFRFYE